MAIGNFYPISPTVVDQDLFLGTKLGGNNTVNYTGQTVANYLSTKITIGGQVSFIFDTTPGIPKTISFSGGGGDNTPFSSITQLIVSSIDALGANVTVFLNYINGSEILLSERTEPNIFGHYKIVGYTVTANPAFYTLNLQFIGGNGAITNGVYYNLSSFVLSSSLGTPTLNQVLTAGNTSIIDAKVGNLYSYDNVNADYGIVQFYDSGVALKGASTNNLLFYNDDTGTVKFSNGTYAPTLNFAGVGNNVYTFQNANGTLAFLSDIPSVAGYVPTSRTLTINGTTYDLTANRSWSVGTVTSIGMTVPSAFNVTPSTITSSGTFAITGAGVASQYVRGDGTLANFPTSTGGGASVSYYLNGSISQGTIGGVAYKEMNSVPVIGTGTDFTINADGYIAQFITDVGDPNKLLIPSGNWNFETYFSASSGGGSPRFYIELYKYNGTTFTLIASNSTSPEFITGDTSIDLYFSALAVPPTTLTVTDRLAVRFYVIHSGRTITMHTENSHLSQVITTFSSGLTALNGLTSQVQYFSVGTSGTDFNISSATDTHTFNLPTASAANRGALSSADWTAFNSKFNLPSLTSGSVLFSNGTTIAQDNAQFFWDDTNNRLGIGTSTPTRGKVEIIQTLDTSSGGLATVNSAISGSLRLWVDSTGVSNIANGTTSNISILSSGNVGIGTTAPSQKLELIGNAVFRSTQRIDINTAQPAVVGVLAGSSIGTYGNFSLISSSGTTGESMDISYWNSTTYLPAFRIANVSSGFSNLLLMKDGGNVGIGTSTPSLLLQVGSRAGIGSDGVVSWGQALTGNNRGYLSWDTDIASVNAISNLVFRTNTSSERMRITSAGNVGIGTTNPSQRLEVVGNVIVNNLAPFIDLYSTQTGTPSWKIYNSYNVIGDFSIVGGSSITNKFNIQPNGNVGIGTTSPGAILDILATSSNILRLGRTGYDTFLFRSSIGTGLELFNLTDLRSEMFFDGNGNVGIGTTSPTAKLHIAAPGALSTDIALKVRNSADTADLMTVNGVGQLGIDRNFGLKFLLSSVISAPSNGSILITDAAGTSFGRFQFGGTSNLFPSIKRNTTNLEFKLADDSAFTGIISATSLVGGTSLNSSAILQADSTTKGFLPPRMTNAQRLAIATPAVGLCVYCTDATEGLYIYKSTGWTFII